MNEYNLKKKKFINVAQYYLFKFHFNVFQIKYYKMSHIFFHLKMLPDDCSVTANKVNNSSVNDFENMCDFTNSSNTSQIEGKKVKIQVID